MKKIIKLTESDLTRIIKKVIMEQEDEYLLNRVNPFIDADIDVNNIPDCTTKIMNMPPPPGSEPNTKGYGFINVDGHVEIRTSDLDENRYIVYSDDIPFCYIPLS